MGFWDKPHINVYFRRFLSVVLVAALALALGGAPSVLQGRSAQAAEAFTPTAPTLTIQAVYDTELPVTVTAPSPLPAQKTIKQLEMALNGGNLAGSLCYRVKAVDGDWQSWQNAGDFTQPQDSFQGLELKLNGDLSTYYDIYYRVHVSPRTGWLAYASNGAKSGFDMAGKSIDNIQVVLVLKGAKLTQTLQATPSVQAASAAQTTSTPSASTNAWQWNRAQAGTGYLTKDYPLWTAPLESGVKRCQADTKQIVSTSKHKYKVQIARRALTQNGLFAYILYKGKYWRWVDLDAFDRHFNDTYKLSATIVSLRTSKPLVADNDCATGTRYATAIPKGERFQVAYKVHDALWGTQYYKLPDGRYLKAADFNLDVSDLKPGDKIVEKAIAYGMTKVKKSKYLWGGGRTSYWIEKNRFDCSSFVHWCYAKAGKRLGPTATATTVTLRRYGKHVSYKQLRRGDLIFFLDSDRKRIGHVAIYLGDGFFLHDSDASSCGGVDIDNLADPRYRARLSGTYRRVA